MPVLFLRIQMTAQLCHYKHLSGQDNYFEATNTNKSTSSIKKYWVGNFLSP